MNDDAVANGCVVRTSCAARNMGVSASYPGQLALRQEDRKLGALLALSLLSVVADLNSKRRKGLPLVEVNLRNSAE